MALIAHWPLNGNTEDYTGNGNHGTSTNITYSDGKIGLAGEFNGSNAYITTSNQLTETMEFSFSAWVKTDSTTTQTIVCSRTTVGGGFSIFILGQKIRFDSGASWQWSTGYTVPLNQWVHITVTRSSSGRKLFVNGSLVASTTAPGNMLTLGSIMSFGASQANGTGWGNYLSGNLNDLRIYNHVLSEKEIKELSKGLILHYPMDDPHLFIENNSDVMRDISGYGNDLIIDGVNPPLFSNDSEVNMGSFEFSQNEGLYQDKIISIPTDQMTISLWVKPKGSHTGGQGTIVTKNTSFYFFLNNDQKVRTYWANTKPVAGYHTSNNSLPLNEWSMVSAVWDGENMKIFIDGELDKSIENTTPGNDNPQFPISIGYEYGSGPGSRFLNGLMNDVRIYATALSDEDILELYRNRVSFDNKGNVFNYHIEQENLDSDQTIPNKFEVKSTGSINPTTINQIDHNLNQETTKQRLKEDGTLEIDGYIIQN